MLQAKTPRREPRWSRNRPPHAACVPIKEPFVFTFIQGVEGAFKVTNNISLTRRLCGETDKASRSFASEAITFTSRDISTQTNSSMNTHLSRIQRSCEHSEPQRVPRQPYMMKSMHHRSQIYITSLGRAIRWNRVKQGWKLSKMKNNI